VISFKPVELRDKFFRAMEVMDSITQDWDPDLRQMEPNAADYDDIEVTESTEISFWLNEALERTDSTVREVMRWAECLEQGKLIGRGAVIVPGQTIFYVRPANRKAEGIVYEDYPCSLGDLGMKSSAVIDGKACSLELVNGFTPFNLFAEKELDCDDKVYPSYGERDVFAVVSYDGDLALEKARALCTAYLFELASCHDVAFSLSEFPEVLYDYAESLDEDEGGEESGFPVRALDLTKGLPELYSLYVEGATSNTPEWAFVSFIKAIEYVSVTVVRRTAHGEIRARLMAPEALRPDAAYIDGLIQLVASQREYAKQREYIRRAIVECCDMSRIAPLLPTYLRETGRVERAADQKAIAGDVSDAIVATRNYLVHAKAAYENTGRECPEGQLNDFVACAREIAREAIVWYQGLSEHARLAGPGPAPSSEEP